ncbi:hypothetical protein [Sphingomonas sp. JC676]|uniref:hypothetical protein n=1 Tax=Sphingomonas sp. JC676 TaxID=2768065 RepID=UPI00223BBAE4|nr:hypothetical protein [Sphingomonas sp. JC676]
MPDRFRSTFRRRGAAFVLALIVELLIALLLLGLIPTISPKEKSKPVVFGISTNEGNEPAAKQQAKAKAKAAKADKPEPQPQPPKPEIVPPPPVPQAKQPPSFLVLTREDYATGDIAKVRSSAPSTATADAGDAAAGGSEGLGDSEKAGKGPHGEQLYAAEWYRRPTDAEISPYISERARGVEGWGEIACRTVARYRVEDCQELGDYPRGSGYAGSVRQAAFQFLVKPPRVNGKLLVGTWVRIRITYTERGRVE